MAKKSKKVKFRTRLVNFYREHRAISVVGVLIAVFLIFIGIMSAVDAYKINQVNKDLEELQLTLKQNGFDGAKLEKYCWRTSGKYGAGAKVCDSKVKEQITLSKSEDEKERVNKTTLGYISIVNSSDLFGNTDFSIIHSPGEGSFSSSSNSYHLSTSTSCSTLSTYDWDKHELLLFFTCDTTPWLTRTFGI